MGFYLKDLNKIHASAQGGPPSKGGSPCRLFFRGQAESYRVVFKMTFVGAITKGFVLGKPAAADRNDLTSAEVIFITIAVYDLEIAFYFERTVVINCNFCGCHVVELGRENKGKRFRVIA
jgi:hypothetical protein